MFVFEDLPEDATSLRHAAHLMRVANGYLWKNYQGKPTKDFRQRRFWLKVDIGDPDECWNWTGANTSRGYGHLQRSNDGIRKSLYAHRVAFELSFYPIPEGAYVLHRCDNPPCCNPKHLFLGDAKANAADRETKGRGGLFKLKPGIKVEGIIHGRASSYGNYDCRCDECREAWRISCADHRHKRNVLE